MALVRMQKMALLAHKKLSDALLTHLQEAGVLEITTEEATSSVDHTESNFRIADIDFAIQELTNIAPKHILSKLHDTAEAGQIIAVANRTDTSGIIARLHALNADNSKLEHERSDLAVREAGLRSWATFRESLPPSLETESSVRFFGILQSVKMQEFHDALRSDLPRTSLEKVGDIAGSTTLSAFVWKKDREKFEEIATVHGWTTIRPPDGVGLPVSLLEDMSRRSQDILRQLDANNKERLAMTESLPDLMKVRTFVTWLQQREAVRETMISTESMILVTGWMPEKEIPMLKTSLSSISHAIALLPIEPKPGEEPPVLMRNSLLISPFESVTTLYGLPLATEMDPTASLAPFFALFFALCITDAGYGLAIAMIMGLYLFVTKQPIRKAPLWWTVFFGGIAAFFVGIPFGGWFGLDPNKLPAILDFVRTPVGDGYWFKLQVWNLGTQEGISFLQNLALILGITHLFFGMFLAGWHKWIHGQKASAFWEHFTAHILLVAVLIRAFAPAEYVPAATYGLYSAVALMIWGKGIGNPWYLRPVMGLLGVMNFAIGLLSNGLSYLRILALGLVTGAIALAVDQVAAEMGKLFPIWLGIPVMIVVAIGGHTVSIALNTLGSFIHAGRLQFIEFFSQFFEGGGKAFSPFSRTTNP